MCIFAGETAPPARTPLEASNLIQPLDCEHEVTVYIGVQLSNADAQGSKRKIFLISSKIFQHQNTKISLIIPQ